MARKFFYVCAGILMLAVSYHLGARNASAQAGAPISGVTAWGTRLVVMTPNGDVFSANGNQTVPNSLEPPIYLGNFWGGATATSQQSWGKVKDRYRK